MFEWALKANLPIIGVTTDDIGNFAATLQLIAGGKPHYMGSTLSATVLSQHHLYWTDKLELVTTDLYTNFIKNSRQLIVVNPEAGNTLLFYAGEMPTPISMIENFVAGLTDTPGIVECLKGLSLKTASEACYITEARTGSLLPKELRRTRSMLTSGSPGLTLVDTDVDFYDVPKELAKWMQTNSKFFTTLVHPKLTPRGLLLSGTPGTGKSLSAKYISKAWQVPLYHLDLAGLLTRYVGASEERLRNILASLDREEPCVVLIDEVEKVINTEEDTGVTKRLLSQLLWWMQEHESRVFTVLTTNKLDAIPPEMYRPGRIDRVLEVQGLKGTEQIAKFMLAVWKSIVPADKPCFFSVLPDDNGKLITEASQAYITGRVYEIIKESGVLTN